MKKKTIVSLFGVLISVFLSLILVNAATNFSVSPSSVSQTVDVSEYGSFLLNITNTGSADMDFTVSDTDLSDGSHTITLTANDTSIDAVAADESALVNISYTVGSDAGTYTGNVIIAESGNSSNNVTVAISVIVNGPSVKFEDYGSTLTMDIDVDDNSETKTFVLVNDGNVTITDIEIDLDSTFSGDNDDIDDNDFEINGNDGDETYVFDDEEGSGFSMDVGDTYNVKLKLNIPSNLDVDDYRGDIDVSFKVGAVSYSETFTLKVVATSENEDIFIEQNSLYVKDGVLEITAEAGESVDDYEFIVVNDASYDIDNLTFKLDGNLQEEDSSRYIAKSLVSFNPDSLDIADRDEENVEVLIDISDDQATGTYLADIELYDSQGRKKDTISLRLKVVGDVYVEEINYDKNVLPGDVLEVEVVVKNKGSKIYRDVDISATLFDIDIGKGDMTESSSKFILNVNEEKTVTLRFKVPEEASDGSHTMEVTVEYGDSDFTEVEEVIVDRPANNIVVDSYSINPRVAKCDKELFTYIKFKNLGKYDKDVKVTVEIEGTNVKKSSSTYELTVDEIDQSSNILDITSLEPGNYNVVQKINYDGLFIKKESAFTVLECINTSVGVIVKPLDNETMNNETGVTDIDKITIFGNDFEKPTVYLGGGVGLVVILIVIALFML